MRFPRLSLLALAILVIPVLSCELLDRYETTYVVPTVLNVRKGPSTKQPVVTRVRRGQELRIVSRQDPWVNVLLADDTPGWVHGNYVGSAEAVRASLQGDLKQKLNGTVRTRKPKPVTRSRELTIDGLLADLPADIPTEILPPLEGVSRVMGATREGQVVVEFWGEENRLQRAMMMVTVLNVEDPDLDVNALYAVGFVKNALPGLNRDLDWMLQRLRTISSRDSGSGELQAKGRIVSFEFLKALGAVRVTVVPNA